MRNTQNCRPVNLLGEKKPLAGRGLIFTRGFALAVWLLAAAAILYLRGGLHFDLFGVVCLAACLISAGSFAWYGETSMTFWKLLFILLSASLFLVSATGAEQHLLADFRAFFAPFALFLRDACPHLPMTARAFFGKRRETRTAVRLFQGRNSLRPNGVVDMTTWDELMRQGAYARRLRTLSPTLLAPDALPLSLRAEGADVYILQAMQLNMEVFEIALLLKEQNFSKKRVLLN